MFGCSNMFKVCSNMFVYVRILCVQVNYPCATFSVLPVNWVDLWTNPKYSVWMHPKNFKYTHKMRFCDVDPLAYQPVESETED